MDKMIVHIMSEDEITTDVMSVDEGTIDTVAVDEMTVQLTSVNEWLDTTIVYKITVENITVDKIPWYGNTVYWPL